MWKILVHSHTAAIVTILTFVWVVFIFFVSADFDTVKQWSLWDRWRVDYDEKAPVILADLRNDPDRQYTVYFQDVIRSGGFHNQLLGRPWAPLQSAGANTVAVDHLLRQSGSILLIEGEVQFGTLAVSVWMLNAPNSREFKYNLSEPDFESFRRLISELLVDGMREVVVAEQRELESVESYDDLRMRLINVRRQVHGKEYVDEVDFLIAYLAGERGRLHEDLDAEEVAREIYGRLATETGDTLGRVQALNNLALVELREAQRLQDPELARAAFDKAVQVEEVASASADAKTWAHARTAQTAADILLNKLTYGQHSLIPAIKRQVETLEEVGRLVGPAVSSDVTARLYEARRSIAPLRSADHTCVAGEGGLLRGYDPSTGVPCRRVSPPIWNEADFGIRLARVERFLHAARAQGDRDAIAHYIGVRADLLRKFGVTLRAPHLLVASFEMTYQFRTLSGIVDEYELPNPFEIGIPAMAIMVAEEVDLALACADSRYGSILRDILAGADLWCDRWPLDACQSRHAWRDELIDLLAFALQDDDIANDLDFSTPVNSPYLSDMAWELASWSRSNRPADKVSVSLCPNRPLGLGENESHRDVESLRSRTRRYAALPHIADRWCPLPTREVLSLPVPYEIDSDRAVWLTSVQRWIEKERNDFVVDIAAIKECQSIPW